MSSPRERCGEAPSEHLHIHRPTCRGSWPIIHALAAVAIAAVAATAPHIAPHVATAQIGRADVSVRAVPQFGAAHPGDSIEIAVIFEHGPTYHTWPNDDQLVIPPEFGGDFPAIATEIDIVSVPEGATHGQVYWPEPAEVTVYYTAEPVALRAFHETTIARITVSLPLNPQETELSYDFLARFQSCDATNCYQPEDVALRVPIRVLPEGAPTATSAAPGLFGHDGPSDDASGSELEQAVPPGEPTAAATGEHVTDAGGGYRLALTLLVVVVVAAGIIFALRRR